tara:strand:- start:19404 stop:19664 length:261 start_codon:yes stop_codon:yes gene_type:complete
MCKYNYYSRVTSSGFCTAGSDYMKLPNKQQGKTESPLAVGIAIGVAIGVALGVALENLALGIGVGIALGAAIASTKAKKEDDGSED